MAKDTSPPERVTEIVALPERPRRLPESFAEAAVMGDLASLRLFLERGASVEERSVGYATPLCGACAAGELESIRWLIAHGANLEPPGAAVKAGGEIAHPPLEIPGHGTFAIYIQGGVHHGLWQM